jgi:enediyne polyketide synthase
VPGPWNVSAAHADDLTLAVAGLGPVACDLEKIVPRSISTWQDLLGDDRFLLAEVITHARDEDSNTAATRVWAAGECLTKAGALPGAPLVLCTTTADGWVVLTAGPLAIATLATKLRRSEEAMVLALLVQEGSCDPMNTDMWSALKRQTWSAMSTT